MTLQGHSQTQQSQVDLQALTSNVSLGILLPTTHWKDRLIFDKVVARPKHKKKSYHGLTGIPPLKHGTNGNIIGNGVTGGSLINTPLQPKMLDSGRSSIYPLGLSVHETREHRPRISANSHSGYKTPPLRACNFCFYTISISGRLRSGRQQRNVIIVNDGIEKTTGWPEGCSRDTFGSLGRKYNLYHFQAILVKYG
jgi:hypothetical protein